MAVVKRWSERDCLKTRSDASSPGLEPLGPAGPPVQVPLRVRHDACIVQGVAIHYEQVCPCTCGNHAKLALESQQLSGGRASPADDIADRLHLAADSEFVQLVLMYAPKEISAVDDLDSSAMSHLERSESGVKHVEHLPPAPLRQSMLPSHLPSAE